MKLDLLGAHYVRTIKTLGERYGSLGAATFFGGTPVADRQEITERFQSDPALRVLVANPATAGTGLTLTAATYAIYETLSWRYDLYAQSQDRNHRIGQDRGVTYLRLIAVDTIEEAIVETLERKRQLAVGVLGDDTQPVATSQMTPDDLIRLVQTGRLD